MNQHQQLLRCPCQIICLFTVSTELTYASMWVFGICAYVFQEFISLFIKMPAHMFVYACAAKAVVRVAQLTAAIG